MRTILALLKRSRVLLLFLALEVLAFSWIISERSYQRSIAIDQLNSFSAGIQKKTDQGLQYLYLRDENQALAEQNARLHNQLPKAYLFESPLSTKRDSQAVRRFRSLPARVIGGSHFKRNNYLTIDRGRSSGLKTNMGVIGPEGVVGIVTQVTEHFASVLPLINPNFSLNGSLVGEGYYGPVRWPGKDYRISRMEDIPRYAQIDSGMAVVTDGRSRIFPAGIAIGEVIDKKLQIDQNFYEIDILLSTDFSRLQTVYVIKDFFRDELDSLKQSEL